MRTGCQHLTAREHIDGVGCQRQAFPEPIHHPLSASSIPREHAQPSHGADLAACKRPARALMHRHNKLSPDLASLSRNTHICLLFLPYVLPSQPSVEQGLQDHEQTQEQRKPAPHIMVTWSV